MSEGWTSLWHTNIIKPQQTESAINSNQNLRLRPHHFHLRLTQSSLMAGDILICPINWLIEVCKVNGISNYR